MGTRTRALALLIGAGLSAWMGSAALQGPAPRPVPPLAPAAPRPPTSDELQTLAQAWGQLATELDAAAADRGTPLPLDALEATRADGTPWLPGGIPDNPLLPGVGWVVARCPPTGAGGPPADWRYCPETGAVAPGGAPASRAPLRAAGTPARGSTSRP